MFNFIKNLISKLQWWLLKQVQKIYEKSLYDKRGVEGVGIGYKIKDGKITKQKCIMVLVRTKMPTNVLLKEEKIPSRVLGYRTDVFDCFGDIETTNRKIRQRPAKAGMSCANFRVTACTLGLKVFKNGKSFLLGNAHCLMPHWNKAKLGDEIWQPSRIDGGSSKDTIANLSEYIPISFKKPNLVDAALAEIINPDDVSNKIAEIGAIKLPTTNIKPGQIIKKSGRTTGLTSGRVLAVNATAMVNFRVGGKKILTRWKDQIITEAMVDGGDSSSLAVNSKNQPIGLCYAGSPRVSIFNRIQNVQRLLGFTFTPPAKPIEGWVTSRFIRYEDELRVWVRRLNIREEPGLSGKRITFLEKGQRIKIIDDENNGVFKNGHHWWRVLTRA